MTNKRWQPGAVICKTLRDGWAYYGRLLRFPWAAFYRYRTSQPTDDVQGIIANRVLFTLTAHKSLLKRGEWKVIGNCPLDDSLRSPRARVIWNRLMPDDWQIIDDHGVMRKATRDECKGLEPAAAWEPEHVADRLIDAFAGVPDRWLTLMLPPDA